jgi:hypothetical protein
MLYCFDTSAINQLCDDSERQALVRGVLAAHSVYVTAVNCVEVLATKNPARRGQLHKLLKELAGGQSPLALPLDLLKILTLRYAEGVGRPGTRYLAYGLSVDDFFALDGKTEDEITQHRANWEKSFGVFAKVRASFEEVFTSGATERPASFADLIRDHYREEAFIVSLIQDLYGVTRQTLPADKVTDFLEQIPEWAVVLLSLAYATYTRSMQREGFGHRGKAGAVDLWSSAYLPHCDVFVTHDYDQFKAFRFGNRLNTRRTRIARYSEFRVGLLVG